MPRMNYVIAFVISPSFSSSHVVTYIIVIKYDCLPKIVVQNVI